MDIADSLRDGAERTGHQNALARLRVGQCGTATSTDIRDGL